MLESKGGLNDWGLEINYSITNLMVFFYFLLTSYYLLILTVILLRLSNSDSQIVVSSR